MMKKWRLTSMLLLLTLVLTGCGEPYLSTFHPAGEVAKMQYDLLILASSIMFLVILVVVIIYVIVLIRFRRKKGEENKIPKQVEGSHKLEVIWTVIPILLLTILAIPTLIYTFKLGDVRAMDRVDEEGNPEALVVKVRANLYWWEFEYPDLGIVTSQDLIVPTDEKVYFHLSASDVKHSFWIPAAGGKLDTNTDNVNKFYLVFDSDKADEVGNIFYGKCAELCGPSHALMDFKVKAIPRDEFDNWAKAMKESKEPELTDLGKQGQQLFEENSCIACHAVTGPDSREASLRKGPNLADFGNRTTVAGYLEYTEENIKNWVQNPEKYKKGNQMYKEPANFTTEELDALAEYLMSLKVQ